MYKKFHATTTNGLEQQIGLVVYRVIKTHQHSQHRKKLSWGLHYTSIFRRLPANSATILVSIAMSLCTVCISNWHHSVLIWSWWSASPIWEDVALKMTSLPLPKKQEVYEGYWVTGKWPSKCLCDVADMRSSTLKSQDEVHGVFDKVKIELWLQQQLFAARAWIGNDRFNIAKLCICTYSW